MCICFLFFILLCMYSYYYNYKQVYNFICDLIAVVLTVSVIVYSQDCLVFLKSTAF